MCSAFVQPNIDASTVVDAVVRTRIGVTLWRLYARIARVIVQATAYRDRAVQILVQAL